MPSTTHRPDLETPPHPRGPESRDRELAVRRARHIARLVAQDHDALRRAIELAAALRSLASALVELREAVRLGPAMASPDGLDGPT